MISGRNVQQSLPSCGNNFLAIVAFTAIIWKPGYMETAQRSKSQQPLNFFGSDHSNRIETSLYSVHDKKSLPLGDFTGVVIL